MISRRCFIAGVSSVVAMNWGGVHLNGMEPIARVGASRLKLSLAAYSLRHVLSKNVDGWDLFKFVDYCAEQGLSGSELTSYYFPTEVSDAYILDLKRHCHHRGITVSGGAIANDFCQSDRGKLRRDIEYTKLWIDRYALLGAPCIRIYAGSQPKESTWEETLSQCVDSIEECCEYALRRGVILAIENHGGVTALAARMLEIVKRVQAKSFGVNFDSGNFRSTDDPYSELVQIAPYAVNAQLKVEMTIGQKLVEADLERIVGILRSANYSGWVALEYEAKEDPFQAIPKWLRELERLIALKP